MSTDWKHSSDHLHEMPTNVIPSELRALAAQEHHDGYDWDMVQEAGDRFEEVLDSHTELLAAIKDDLANRLAITERKSCGHPFHCVCAGDRLNKAIRQAEVYSG